MTAVVRRMRLADLPEVAAIDQLSFPIPWSPAAYEYELTGNATARFWVALAGADVPPAWRGRPPAAVVGFTGYWLIIDEAHIGTLAVHPDWRGRGLGEQLLLTLLAQAAEAGAILATLEVRVSNRAAQGLYRKHGFSEVGRRKHYYRDNREDALLLSVSFDAAYRENLRAYAAAHHIQETP